MTNAATISGFSSVPAFSATNNTNQSISGSTWTKVSLQVKEFDTANCFDNTTNYRFQPNVAGYYQVSGVAGSGGSAYATRAQSGIFKNGSLYKFAAQNMSSTYINYFVGCVSCIVYLNGTTDYIELYGWTDVPTPVFYVNGSCQSYFTAALIRSA